jgi:hypothetical protein
MLHPHIFSLFALVFYFFLMNILELDLLHSQVSTSLAFVNKQRFQWSVRLRVQVCWVRHENVERGERGRGRRTQIPTRQETLQLQNLAGSCFLQGYCENCNHGQPQKLFINHLMSTAKHVVVQRVLVIVRIYLLVLTRLSVGLPDDRS